ncbi:unnamed protein product, partial [Ixodes pacificus]
RGRRRHAHPHPGIRSAPRSTRRSEVDGDGPGARCRPAAVPAPAARLHIEPRTRLPLRPGLPRAWHRVRWRPLRLQARPVAPATGLPGLLRRALRLRRRLHAGRRGPRPLRGRPLPLSEALGGPGRGRSAPLPGVGRAAPGRRRVGVPHHPDAAGLRAGARPVPPGHPAVDAAQGKPVPALAEGLAQQAATAAAPRHGPCAVWSSARGRPAAGLRHAAPVRDRTPTAATRCVLQKPEAHSRTRRQTSLPPSRLCRANSYV